MRKKIGYTLQVEKRLKKNFFETFLARKLFYWKHF